MAKRKARKISSRRKSTRRKAVRTKKRSIRKAVKRKVTKITKKRRKPKKPDYRLEARVIRMPKSKGKSSRTQAILICPKCKSENIRVVDYMGVKCVICKGCKYDERDVYDVHFQERSAPKVKVVFKVGGHLRTKKRP